MAYYLTYRSKTLNELDLEAVRESLIEMVKSGDIPHALLFSGPKGTGKTSAARILAKVINCEKAKRKSYEPCNKCEQCKSIESGGNIDVIELDAASNRGIDDIRSLRDAVKLSPAKARKKIYVIDEAHMLTTEASNALLKTLEEPPEHVVFIMATTNPEKLIATIRSRVTEIKFKKAIPEEILRSLGRVVKGENLKIEKDALEVIAQSAGGSFRDAHKLLEQLSKAAKKITRKLVLEKLETASLDDLENILKYFVTKDKEKLLEYIENISKNGADIKMFLEMILGELRKALLVKHGVIEGKDIDIKSSELIQLIEILDEAYVKTSTTAIEQLPLEIAIVEWSEKPPLKGMGGSNKTQKDIGEKEEKDQKSDLKTNGNFQESTNGQVSRSANTGINGEVGMDCISSEMWKEVLLLIKPKNTSTEALLRAAKPIGLNGDILTVGVFYNFHKERLEEHFHRTILEEALCKVTGKNIRIICKLTEPPHKSELVEVEKQAQNGESVVGELRQSEQEKKVLTVKEDDDIVKIAEEIFG